MNRVPPSNNRPPPPTIRPKKAPRHVEAKHEIKQEEKLDETQKPELSGEHANIRDHEETALKHAEALGWGAEAHGEAHEKKADKEEQIAQAERESEGSDQNQRHVKQPLKTTTAANKSEQGKPGLHQPQQKKDEFQKVAPQVLQQKTAKPALADLGSTRMGNSEAVSAVKTTDAVREAAERALKSGKPPDAFTLLNQAQPHGVFFKEDYEREGHSEDHEDPALAAAVEECIRQLFGVRGVLRVGAGRNQADEPVIIIAVGQGFGEGSLRAVPEKVHAYTTLLAMPFDVLPLKKER